MVLRGFSTRKEQQASMLQYAANGAHQNLTLEISIEISVDIESALRCVLV